MGSLIYDEYLKAINATLDGEKYNRKFKTLEEYRTTTDDTLQVIIKYYPQSKTGISSQVFNSVEGDEFYIHGPVGNGIGLDQWNSEGINLIFTGGTGILPFMDLFAFMARRILNEDAPNNALFPDEGFYHISEKAKFVVYVYFTTREDAICLDILEAIENLYKKFDKAHIFKINIVFTQEGGNKLEDDEIIELLKDYKFANNGINKLFVCGPPRMNFQFQKLLPIIKGEEIGMAPGD